MARVYTSGGTTADDVIHNAYGLFTGGLGFHLGLRFSPVPLLTLRC